MDSNRLKRPKLERNRPIRTWSTLSRPLQGDKAEPANSAMPGAANERAATSIPFLDPGTRGTIADSVETGYRVIGEYMQQAQAAAQAFNPSAWGALGQTGMQPDMQQLAQRVMQYGWDFVGLYFEMATRMAGSANGVPSPFPGGANGPATSAKGEPASATAPEAPRPSEAGPPRLKRFVVSVSCDRPTAASVELQPGPFSALVVHALRPEGHKATPIRGVTVTQGPADLVTLKVSVPAGQPAGTYNGMIVDTESNLPRGTVSVRVEAKSIPR
jgi:hypothetical protein